jgi:hypothetical protein
VRDARPFRVRVRVREMNGPEAVKVTELNVAHTLASKSDVK